MATETDAYTELQKHLDKMPVGYPATKSGVEINLLKTIFTPEEATITGVQPILRPKPPTGLPP